MCYLLPEKLTDNGQASPAIIKFRINQLRIHLWMSHRALPQPEDSSRKASGQPGEILPGDSTSGLIAFLFYVEDPRRSIPIQVSEVEGILTLHAEGSAAVVWSVTVAH